MSQGRSQIRASRSRAKPTEPNEREKSLAELEAFMESKMEVFLEAAACLQEIRDRMLFMDQYGRFDVYLRERWGIKGPAVRGVRTAVDAPIITQINEESHE